jgi:SAM-dependent methyltransferase
MNSKLGMQADRDVVQDDCFETAREILLASHELNDEEKEWVKTVSLRVHRKDRMYVPPHAQHYLSVGLSAIRCIRIALEKSPRTKAVSSILDLPCGYGRVLRFMKVVFPDAEITASEIDPDALRFCSEEFSVRTARSDENVARADLQGAYDLIWCGSLLTHIDARAAAELLRLLSEKLLPNGVCVFTTHGPITVEWLKENRKKYGLSAMARQDLLTQFRENGYGYANYEKQDGYGTSAVSYRRMLSITSAVGQWDEIAYLEHGWDNHQDVYGFIKV